MHRISANNAGLAIVVAATGELDAYVADELSAALGRADAETRLIVDLTSVSFMDSTALGVLVRSVRDREGRGLETRVVLPRGTARRIFELTALDQALPVSPSLEEAMR